MDCKVKLTVWKGRSNVKFPSGPYRLNVKKLTSKFRAKLEVTSINGSSELTQEFAIPTALNVKVINSQSQKKYLCQVQQCLLVSCNW